jgi:hypothetical protein
MEMKYKVDHKGGVKTVITDTVFFTEVSDSWYAEDTENLVNDELRKWKNSDAGGFITNKSIGTPSFYTQRNIYKYSVEIAVVATMEQKHFSEYLLRWGKHGSNKS